MPSLKLSIVVSLMTLAACSSSPGKPDGAAGSGPGGGAGTTGAGAAGGGAAGATGTGGSGPSCAGSPTHCGGINVAAPCTIAPPVVPTSPPTEQTACNSSAPTLDQCGCDGKTCAGGQACARALTYVPGGPDFYVNRCTVPCVATIDCGPNDDCAPDTAGLFECRPTPCRSDADCTDDGCGHCAPALRTTHIVGATPVPDVHVCVYEGACAASSCVGCAAAGEYFNAGTPGYHTCTGG